MKKREKRKRALEVAELTLRQLQENVDGGNLKLEYAFVQNIKTALGYIEWANNKDTKFPENKGILQGSGYFA